MSVVAMPRRASVIVRGAVVAVLLGAVIALCAKGIGTVPYAAAIITYPFQIDDAEGVILAEATLIREGIDPYAHQPSPAPYFYAGPYPPVFTAINAAAIAAFGPTFKVGRAVQLLATVAVAVWLAWAVSGGRRVAGRIAWLGGTWAALLWLTTHLVTVWGVLVRPDMTALACNLAGVFVLRRLWWSAERAWRTEGWPRGCMLGTLVLGAACFALGWWTKQTFVAVPVAFIVMLGWGRPRAAVTLAGLYGGFLAVPFLVLTALTRGGFAQKIVGYQGSWEWGAFWRLAEPFARRYGLLIALAVVAAIICTRSARRPTFAAVWFVLAGIAALGAGTSGGNHNHFVEFLAAATLLVGQAVVAGVTGVQSGDSWTGALSHTRRWAVPACTMAAVLLLTTGALMEQEGRYGWLAREYATPTANERTGTAAVAAYLANAPAPVLSDNVGILVVARQPVLVTDPFTMAAEVRLGRWDESELVAAVADGKFSVIALRERELDPAHPPTDLTPALVRAIQARYRLAERNVLNLYVPK